MWTNRRTGCANVGMTETTAMVSSRRKLFLSTQMYFGYSIARSN